MATNQNVSLAHSCKSTFQMAFGFPTKKFNSCKLMISLNLWRYFAWTLDGKSISRLSYCLYQCFNWNVLIIQSTCWFNDKHNLWPAFYHQAQRKRKKQENGLSGISTLHSIIIFIFIIKKVYQEMPCKSFHIYWEWTWKGVELIVLEDLILLHKFFSSNYSKSFLKLPSARCSLWRQGRRSRSIKNVRNKQM